MAVMIPAPDAELSYEGDDQWLLENWVGMRVARRQYLRELYAVRVLVAEAMQAEARKRMVTKPYNLFAIWFLFVAAHTLPAMDREYVRAMGQKMVETLVYVGGEEKAHEVSESTFDAIADVEESRPQ
jgi:hypothetical protein